MSTLSIMPTGSWDPKDLFNLFPKKDQEESVTLHENRESYVVVASFPGFIKDEIHINFKRGVLDIYASSYLVSRNQSASRFYAKRNIHRSITVGGEIVEDQIRYLYERNVLKIWLPKKARPSKSHGLLQRFQLLRRFRSRK